MERTFTSILAMAGFAIMPAALANGFYAHRGDSVHHMKMVQEFLRRFLLHVLPRGLVRILNLGFLANRRQLAGNPTELAGRVGRLIEAR